MISFMISISKWESLGILTKQYKFEMMLLSNQNLQFARNFYLSPPCFIRLIIISFIIVELKDLFKYYPKHLAKQVNEI